jgi:quercetin dioxygenase-like cupin family protein
MLQSRHQKRRQRTLKIKHWTDVPAEDIPGLEGATIRWVINEQDGAPHFALRVIEVQPGAATPHHSHWWEHEIFVLNGKGVAITKAGETPMSSGTTILTAKDKMHQFRNVGQEVLRFICLVPFQWLEGLAEKHANPS